MIPRPTLREGLRHGPVFGSFVKIPRYETVELLALAGFDFLVFDSEHGQYAESELLSMIGFARAGGIPVVVRVATLERGTVNRLLEAGASGIQLARTRCEDAVALSDAMRYPPIGSRSVSLVQPAARYGQRNMRDYLDASNASVLAIGQLETADFADNLAETVAALDVVFIGPVDLSVDLGHDGSLNVPAMTNAIDTIAATCKQASTQWGIYTADLDGAAKAMDNGAQFIVISSDLAMLMRGANSVSPESLRR